MIINRIQKIILCDEVRKALKNFGKNQEKSTYELVQDRKNVYKVETDGKTIILYDFVDPDVFMFNSYDDFKDFVMQNW